MTVKDFIQGFHGVRYQTKDVSRAVSFYTGHLGFKLEHQQLPAFAAARVVLRVSDLEKLVAACREAGLRFRNEMLAGPGGKQIQLLDPDGNPIELFEPAPRPVQ